MKKYLEFQQYLCHSLFSAVPPKGKHILKSEMGKVEKRKNAEKMHA
jgi:hypothetical protein